jgi:hypothetical protein
MSHSLMMKISIMGMVVSAWILYLLNGGGI